MTETAETLISSTDPDRLAMGERSMRQAAVTEVASARR